MYPNEQEAKEKMYANQSKMAQGSVGYQSSTLSEAGAYTPNVTAGPMRDSLFNSLVGRLDRAKREARKGERLERLVFLLQKHPEISEILDIMKDMEY